MFDDHRLPSSAEAEQLRAARAARHEPTPEVVAAQVQDHLVCIQGTQMIRVTQDWVSRNLGRLQNFARSGEWK